MEQAMSVRNRTASSPGYKGDAWRLGSHIGGGTYVKVSESCTDTISPGDGHFLSVNKFRKEGGVINNHPWQTSRVFTEYVCDYMTGNAELSTHLSTDRPTDYEVAAITAARTNPSRPETDLPVAVGELKDFPQLFRSALDIIRLKSWIKKGANANLAYQFGIAPLISDFNNLMTFSNLLDKRVEELKRLKEKGLRRTIRIGGYSNSVTYGRTFQSNFASFGGTVTCVTRQLVSGYIKWYPQRNSWPTNGAEIRNLAKRAILGLTVDPSTFWELIPFSWLVDWCSSAGTFLMSTRNIIPATHSPVQVMCTTQSEWTFPSVTNQWGVMSSGRSLVDSKSRNLTSPAISAHLPVLSNGQLSILGSIGVLSGNSRIYRG
jgi:hypothetical protein